jgi:ribosome biogenesis GTPase
MHLQDLGYTEEIDQYIRDNRLEAFTVGRITAEHKERYVVRTETGELTAEITGNLRFSARDRSDFPAVGDWVTLTVFDDSLGIINAILPRKTVLERRAVGKFSEKQIIAANIDVAFIMQSVDQDFNINRLERYLAICLAAEVAPVILLSKTDLITPPELEQKVSEIRKRQKSAPILPFSNETQNGYDDLLAVIEPGKTYCMMGSSGVGKSTLINNLTGEATLKTSAISTSTQKGRHTTSHRELFLLENGGILIDTPGMREIGMTENIEETIDELAEYAQNCKYKDCTHMHEEGCAVIAAVEEGAIDEAAYENYVKMYKESKHFQASAVEKRQKDKALGKMYKEVMKHKKKRKF